MSRCTAFHHMYDKDATKCGMSPVSESYYKRYRDVVRKLVSQKLDEDQVYDNFTEGAYRVILAIKNDDAKTDAVSYVSECLHNGEKVTDRDLRGWFKVWKIENGVQEPEKLTNVNVPTQEPVTEPLQETPILSLGERVRAQEMAAATENQPKLSPFKTAAEVLAHDKDPLGIGPDPATVRDNITVQPSKTDKELFLEHCQMAYDHGNSEFKMAVDELMRYHPSWKTPASVIFFCVTDPKEALGGKNK